MKLHQQRTCIGCRTITSQDELLRWVLNQEAPLRGVQLDLSGAASGRGAGVACGAAPATLGHHHQVVEFDMNVIQRVGIALVFKACPDKLPAHESAPLRIPKLPRTRLYGAPAGKRRRGRNHRAGGGHHGTLRSILRWLRQCASSQAQHDYQQRERLRYEQEFHYLIQN